MQGMENDLGKVLPSKAAAEGQGKITVFFLHHYIRMSVFPCLPPQIASLKFLEVLRISPNRQRSIFFP